MRPDNMYFQFYFWFVLLLCASSNCASNDKLIDALVNTEWYCANVNCTDPIAVAKSTKLYPSNHHLKINLKPNDVVNILGKPIDLGELWLVSLGDKLGLAPKNCLLESKIFVPVANCTITKFDFTILPGYKKALQIVSDIKPSPPHNVIHGTTLYDDLSNTDSFDVPPSGSDLTKSNVVSDTDANPVGGSEVYIGENKNDATSRTNILPTSGSISELKSNEKDASLYDNSSKTNSYDVSPSETDITKSNVASDTDANPVGGSEAYTDENKNDGTSHTNILPTSGSISELKPNDKDTSLYDDASKTNSYDVPPETDLIKSNVASDTDANPVGGSEIYTDENKNDATSQTNILPTSGSISELEPNETDTTSIPSTSPTLPLNSKNVTELISNNTKPESISSRFNKFLGKLIGTGSKSGDKAVQSDHPNAGLDESNNEPNTNKENTDDVSVDTEKRNLSPDEVTPNTVGKVEPQFPNELMTVSKTEVKPDSSENKDFNAKNTEEISTSVGLKMTSNTQNDLQSEFESTKTFDPLPPTTTIEHEKLPLSSESPVASTITEFIPVQVNYSSNHTDTSSIKNSNKPKEIKETTPSTAQILNSESIETEVKVTSDAVVVTTHSPEEKDSSTETPALMKSEESYTPPITSITQNSDANVFSFSLPQMSEVVTSIPQNTDLPTEQTNYDRIENTSELNTEAPEPNANEPSVISLDNNVVGIQPSVLPPGDNLPTDDTSEESTTTNWFSFSSTVENTAEELLAKSDLETKENNNVHDLPEGNSNSGMTSDEESVEPNQPIQEPDETFEKGNVFDQSSEQILQKVDEYFGSLTMPSLVGPTMSVSTFTYLTITSVVILIFSLGYYYLENMKQAADYIGKINSLSAELFFAQKELATMEEKLSKSSESFDKMVSNTASNEEALVKMKQEFEESEAMIESLELENKRLKKEIDSLVESGNEMHRMLAESITDDEKIQSLLTNIEDLKTVLSDRLEEIASLTDQLDKEKQEVELLTIALQKAEEKKENIEEKLEKVIAEIDSKALSVANEFEEKVTSLEKIIEESSLERTNFEKEIVELKHQCESLSLEKELAEKSLKKAQGMGPGKALSEWLDSKVVRTELLSTQKEVEKLQRELEDIRIQNTKLLERESNFHSEIEILNNNYETAEKNKIEALTKLQVLSNYFKEKETQLQEELGTKEAQWLQKQSEDHSIYEQMRSLREENLSYRAQNDALKKEILDQEASFKIQIANEEQKAQENWVTLRHTERRLKEAQMETAHLRSRLTAMETNSDTLDDKHAKNLELVNGEVPLGAASPPFMLYPPDFIPLPPLVSPSRPPPLGRISSPPLTPPPPLSPYDLFQPPSPPPLRVHKPQPREPPTRKQKDSQSSNHSSESIEKPVRRGKR